MVAAVAYALNNVLSGIAVHNRGMDYVVAVTLRALPTLVLAFIIGQRHRKTACTPLLADWRLALAYVGYGLLTFTVAGPLQFAALQEGGVVVASPITGTQVLWGAIIAAIFLKERFGRKMAAGMVVSILGITLLSLGKAGAVQLSPTWWLAIPYATGTALCWSLSAVLITYTMRRGVDRFQALAAGVLVGLTCSNAYLALSGHMGAYASTPIDQVVAVSVGGLFGAVALLSITSAMAFTSVASANAINTLQVGIAPLVSWLLVPGESMSAATAVGIALIMVGVIAVQRARLAGEQGPAEPEPA